MRQADSARVGGNQRGGPLQNTALPSAWCNGRSWPAPPPATATDAVAPGFGNGRRGLRNRNFHAPGLRDISICGGQKPAVGGSRDTARIGGQAGRENGSGAG